MKRNFFRIAVLAAVICYPKLSFGQAPNLGSTSIYAVFTASGAIDILGTSTIWGDVGTDVGSYFITTTSAINGNVNNANSNSALAATDVASAYSDLASRTCGLTIAGNNQLGTVRKKLGPDKVFCLGGAQVLDGDLTLDAKNNPSAIFIIQIDGKLSVNAFSKVLLINSASACNVFWQVNGAVEIGGNAVFKGNILANGAISLLNGSSIDGRVLSTAGAASLYNNTAIGCTLSGIPLPVGLVRFTAKLVHDNVHLNWATACESNADLFTVQRLREGQITEDILAVTDSGNSSSINQYSAIDYHPQNGRLFYRLKQTSFNGTIDYSEYVSVFINKCDHVVIYPNPTGSSIALNIPESSHLIGGEIRIFNTLGQEVFLKFIDKQAMEIEADNLRSGVYSYLLISNGEILNSGRFMLNR